MSISGIENFSDIIVWRDGQLSPKFKNKVEIAIDNKIDDELGTIWDGITHDNFSSDKKIFSLQDRIINWKIGFEELQPVKVHYNKKEVEARLTEVGIIYFFDDIFPSITAYVELKSEENFFTFSKSFFGNTNLNYEGIETYCNGNSTVCDINNLNIKLSQSEYDAHIKISDFFLNFIEISENITPENFLFSNPQEKDEEK